MANEQVVVEIVLDDGSIQRGWAKFGKAAGDAAKESSKKLGTIGDVLDGDILRTFTNQIKNIPISFGLVAAGAAAAGLVIKKAFDLTLEAESIARINKQFDILSTQTVGAGANLRQALDDASGGVVDMEDVFQATNKVLIDFKGNASDLPAIFETARKASKVSGGEILDNYQTINKAIATQNTRALQNLGLIVDSSKAQEDYAKSIGKTKQQLTEVEQRQAITNAVLSFSKNQLKDISLTATSATDSYKKFSTQVSDLGDSFAFLTKAAVGGAFPTALDFITKKLERFNDIVTAELGTGAEKTAARITVLKGTIEQLNEKLADRRLDQYTSNRKEIIAEIEDRLRLARIELASVEAQADDERKASRTNGEIPRNVQAAIAADEARIEATRKAEAEIVAIKLAAQQEEINNALLLLESNDLEVQRIILAEAQAAQEVLIEEQKLAAIAALRKQYADQGVVDQSVIQAGILAQQNLFNSKKEAADEVFRKRTKAAEDKLAADEEKKQKERVQGFSSFFGNLSALQQSGSKELFEIGKIAALSQATIDGYAAVTGAYKIGSGIGGPALGAAFAAAAGIAQAANLARIAGTSFGSTSFEPQQTGGPDLGAPDGGIPDQPEDARRTTNEGLVVNVQGDILGDEASGKRLVDLMNAAFDAGGVSLRRGLA